MHELAFTDATYRSRISRVREKMAERGIDVMLIFSQESLYYLFGYDQIGYWNYQCVLLGSELHEPLAICRAADRDIIAALPTIGDVQTWADTDAGGPGRLTRAGIQEMKARDGVVGIELATHALRPDYYVQLVEALSGHSQVDASDLVVSFRELKEPEEIVYVERAAEIMNECFEVVQDVARPGVRECELLAQITRRMHDLGGDPPAISPPIASGPRTLTQTHGAATERMIEAGDILTVEIGAAYRRYHSVGARTFSLGPASAAVQASSDAIVAGLGEGISGLEPGLECSELARRVQAHFSTTGTDRKGRHVGYGIGIGFPPTWLESYRVKESDRMTLRKGMTFFYFAGAHVGGEPAYVIHGDPILMTSVGHRVLANRPRELVVL